MCNLKLPFELRMTANQEPQRAQQQPVLLAPAALASLPGGGNVPDAVGGQIISHPRPQDVLSGRSKICVGHDGSKNFRTIIECCRGKYAQALTKFDKTSVTREIYDHLSLTGARFLKYNSNLQAWEELSGAAARDKIGHALRFANRETRRGITRSGEAIREGNSDSSMGTTHSAPNVLSSAVTQSAGLISLNEVFAAAQKEPQTASLHCSASMPALPNLVSSSCNSASLTSSSVVLPVPSSNNASEVFPTVAAASEGVVCSVMQPSPLLAHIQAALQVSSRPSPAAAVVPQAGEGNALTSSSSQMITQAVISTNYTPLLRDILQEEEQGCGGGLLNPSVSRSSSVSSSSSSSLSTLKLTLQETLNLQVQTDLEMANAASSSASPPQDSKHTKEGQSGIHHDAARMEEEDWEFDAEILSALAPIQQQEPQDIITTATSA